MAFNFVLIPKFGLIGAAMGTLFGYLLSCVVRAYDAHKSIKVDLKLKKSIIALVILLCQYALLFLNIGIFIYLIEAVLTLMAALLFSSEFTQVVLKFKDIAEKRLKELKYD